MRDTPEVSLEFVRSKVEGALKRLLKEDAVLIGGNVNERSITHRLAICLQPEFVGWNVDAEYNRNLGDIKRLRLNPPQPTAEDNDAVTVYPDVIVHRRNTTENLLVVEVKKARGGDIDFDIRKLRAFTDQSPAGLGYIWGVHVVLPAVPEGRPSLTWFAGGAELDVDQPRP
jgi:hypothetical protein